MKVYNIFINKKSKLFQITILLLTLSILTYFIVFSKTNYEIMSSIIDIFISIVIPSLFPFILFSNIIIYTNYFSLIENTILTKILKRFFKTSYTGASAIIFGFLFGYPNGARYVNELYEKDKISFKEAEKLLMFINNSSPAFIISSIGIGMFKNIRIGILLLTSHILSSIIIGKILSYIYLNKNDNKYTNTNYVTLSNQDIINYNITFDDITKAIIKSIYTMCMIFSFMIIFILTHNYILTVIKNISIPNKYFNTFLLCIFEITSGINKLIKLPINLKLLLPLISLFLGFSSLSINFQIFSCIYKNNFKFKNILKGKLLHGILSTLITYALINIPTIYEYINIPQNANYNINSYKYNISINTTTISIYIFIISILMYFLLQRKKETIKNRFFKRGIMF